MKKRILAILLALSMLLTLVPSAFADGVSEGTVATIGEAEFTSLQEAIDETAKEEGTYEIKLIPGVIEESVTIVQKAGVYLTVTGAPEGTTLKGTITVDGQSAQIANQSVTIDGVDIEAAAGGNCIFIPGGGSRYSRNLTVKNCDFTGEGAVGIKQSTAGCINWLIQNCSADETMHSLVQVVNVAGLVIDGCTVRSKNGINLNSSSDVEIKNSTVEVRGYAVRAGVSSGGSSGAVTLTENTLKTDNSEGDAAIVLRGTAATEIDLDMSKNVVSGETHISGTVEETDITADNNYWDGEEDPIVSGAPVDVGSYY
ncbi:MAG: right-handed parallel beta-helix repeat-containing protein, partial [Clostridia bacterium]|nr:right-handed parallel beta-helix repeat-containing protein [Clostridia bacterium]